MVERLGEVHIPPKCDDSGDADADGKPASCITRYWWHSGYRVLDGSFVGTRSISGTQASVLFCEAVIGPVQSILGRGSERAM